MRLALDLDASSATRARSGATGSRTRPDVARSPSTRSAARGSRRGSRATLDARGAGNWRTLLERFADDRAPVYLRPDAEVERGPAAAPAPRASRLGVFTDAPAELARVALAHLAPLGGSISVETGTGALERARRATSRVVRSRGE